MYAWEAVSQRVSVRSVVRTVASRLMVLPSLWNGWPDEWCIERSAEGHAYRNDDGQGNFDVADYVGL